MNNLADDTTLPLVIGHAIVRSNPWTFESADSQTRLFFGLPEGNIGGLPLVIPEYATSSGSLPDIIDVMIAGAPEEDGAIRAKLLAVDHFAGLYSAIFFHPSAGAKAAFESVTQHRISNCLAVIRSIFRRTARASPDADTLVSHFLGRLDAFSRIQSNLVFYDTYGVALEELILDEFMAHATRTGKRLKVHGPLVRLRTRAAETLSLTIHELATNSVKFGALGSESGHIVVCWNRLFDKDEREVLQIHWIETEVSGVDSAPQHRGFGTDMIENSLAFELGAESNVDFHADGLRLCMTLPITDFLLHENILAP